MSYPRTRIETRNTGSIASGRVNEAMATAQRAWMQGVMKRVRDDVRAFSPVDLGAFRKSIFYRTTRRGLLVEGEVYATDTPDGKVAVIEYGRLPGRKMPPSGALLGWMSRHGWDPRKEFVLRRAIAEHGIKGKFPFRKAFAKNRGLFQSQARDLQTVVTRAINRG